MKVLSPERFETILNQLTKASPVLVIGDVGIDKYTFGEVSRISPEAPVPVLHVLREWNKLGLAANVSDNLQGLAVKSTLCGILGADHQGDVLKSLLEDINLSCRTLLTIPNRPTTIKERVTTQIQQICRIDYEDKAELSESDNQKLIKIIEQEIPKHQGIILEDYGKGIFSESLCRGIIECATHHNKMIAVDPSRGTPPKWYRGVQLLKPNWQEAQVMLTALGIRGHHPPEDMCKILLEKLDLKQIVITLGPKGMALLDSQNSQDVELIPTVATEVFDVSGAGDTVISVLTAALLSGASLNEAAFVANCAAGVVVSKKGTARVSLDELRTFYTRYL